MKKIIIAIAMLFTAFGAHASKFVSNSGESMDEFVVRNARSIELIGLKANSEVCGAIVMRDGLFSLEIITNGSNIQCTVSHEPDATLIHTHLPYMGTRFSPADYSHRGYMIRNGSICYNDGERGTEVSVTRYGRKSGYYCATQ